MLTTEHPTPHTITAFLTRLTDLPLEARLGAEAAILRIITAQLTDLLQALNTPRAPLLLRYHKQHARQAAQRRRDLIVAVGEVFGWAQNDRRLHDVLGREDAVLRAGQLQALIHQAVVERDGLPPGYDENGIATLSRFDLVAFFGAEVTYYERYYNRARDLGHWPFQWEWRRFWYGPLWALGLKQHRITLLWTCAAILGIGAFGQLSQACPDSGTRCNMPVLDWLVVTASFVTMAAIHAYVGAYGARLELERLARRVRQADHRNLFDPRPRALFLAKGQPTFRVTTATKPGLLRRWWWVWLAIMSLSQLLSALMRH